MKAFKLLTSTAYCLFIDDIDTDQIIPARYLKVTESSGLGKYLFADWRYLPDGSPNREFVINQTRVGEPQILVTGKNFGCGSSREHAPWALTDFGLRAIISTEFADIFRNNALKNSLLPVQLSESDYAEIVSVIKDNPQAEISIDLANQTVTLAGGREFTFPIDLFSRSCLLSGVDELGYLMGMIPQIELYEQRLLDSLSG